MKETSKTHEDLGINQEDIDKALAEAEVAIAEAEQTLKDLNFLEEKLSTSNGDLDALMPPKVYSEEERTEFVGALSGLVENSQAWLEEKSSSKSTRSTSSKKKSSGRRKRRLL